MQMVCRPLPRPTAHNHGLGIIPAERGVERHQEGLFVGGQESAALIAGATPSPQTTHYEDDHCDERREIEERRRTIEKRFETPCPTGSERLAHRGQRLSHLRRGVRQRVEEETH